MTNQPPVTVKIKALIGNTPRTVEYGDIFAREEAGGHPRLRIGLNRAQDACVRALASHLTGPFQLLYVLHTTRTGAPLGRYESPVLPPDDIDAFLDEFGRFLCEDSRHDLWIRSHNDDATIVLDRHNLIYAYGPLEIFEAALRSRRVAHGVPAAIPHPHVHHYHPGWDDAERAVLNRVEWRRRPLQPSDVQ